MSNMNAREREVAYCFLIAKDGKKCKRCKKSLQELEEEANINEIMTGKERKLPLLVVDCIDNSGDHSDLNNLQFLCWRSLISSANSASCIILEEGTGCADVQSPPPPRVLKAAPPFQK